MRCGRTLDYSIGNRLVRCGDDIDGVEHLCINHRLQRAEERLTSLEQKINELVRTQPRPSSIGWGNRPGHVVDL